jgi:hypothetical protein
MGIENRDKLNSLFAGWPVNTPVTFHALKKMGVTYQHVQNYMRRGWLHSLGRGVFKKPGDKVSWQNTLYYLQSSLGLKLHLGARSVFALLGQEHFVALGSTESVWLFGREGVVLPGWFRGENALQHWDCHVVFKTPRLFSDQSIALTEFKGGEYPLTVSSLERAAFELLYLIPKDQDLVGAKYLFEGLLSIRPNVVQALLEQCTSIKVKRLFLFLADFCHLPCLEYLDLTNVDLGSGKRVIGSGGKYEPKYQLSMPKEFYRHFSEELDGEE